MVADVVLGETYEKKHKMLKLEKLPRILLIDGEKDGVNEVISMENGLKNKLTKIHNFIANKLFYKKFEPILYFIYIIIVLLVFKVNIKNIPTKYIVYVITGLLFLRMGIVGIRDKIILERNVQVSKERAVFGGYILFITSIIILIALYFRDVIFR